eukprot:416139-Prymnesium_polylepis.2
MHLDPTHVRRRTSGVRHGGADEEGLRRRVRRRQGCTAPVLADGAAAEQAVRRRVAQRWAENEGATPFGAHEAVGVGVEGLAAALRREHPCRAVHEVRAHAQLQADRVDDRRAALVAAHRERGRVRGRDRRRARRVEGIARAMQPEHVRQAPTRDRDRVGRDRVDRHLGDLVPVCEEGPIRTLNSQEDAKVAAREVGAAV